MPELPDVENFKDYFNKTSCNKKIKEVLCISPELIKGVGVSDFKKNLIGKSFRKAERRGKCMIVLINKSDRKLVFHFGMTGNLSYTSSESPLSGRDKFARVIFKFENGYELRWLNQRKLGKIWMVEDISEIELLKKMGKEALLLSKKEFFDILSERGKIKSILMDQSKIAGIGNIYSDEILFQSRISPLRDARTLTEKEKEILYKNMKKVLNTAIKLVGKSYPYNGNVSFPKSWIIPHRHSDMICPNNKNHKLRKTSIGGRSSYYCPYCQR